MLGGGGWGGRGCLVLSAWVCGELWVRCECDYLAVVLPRFDFAFAVAHLDWPAHLGLAMVQLAVYHVGRVGFEFLRHVLLQHIYVWCEYFDSVRLYGIWVVGGVQGVRGVLGVHG